MTFPQIEWLAEFASKDQTRYHLNGIYRDEHNFVSTDGHRLIRVSSNMLPASNHPVGKINEAKAFKIGAFSEIEGKYPSYGMLIPLTTDAKHYKTVFPDWIKSVAKCRKTVPVGLHEMGGFTLGDGAMSYINMALVAPLAGQEVEIFVHSDKLKPWVINSVNKGHWTVVVMPLRAGSGWEAQRVETSKVSVTA